jgi:hypothetical protein
MKQAFTPFQPTGMPMRSAIRSLSEPVPLKEYLVPLNSRPHYKVVMPMLTHAQKSGAFFNHALANDFLWPINIRMMDSVYEYYPFTPFMPSDVYLSPFTV